MRVPDKFSLRSPVVGSFVSRLIDPALNLAIILFSLLVVVAFVRSGYLRTPAATNQHTPVSNQVGKKISLQGIDWSKSEQTLLMFLNTQCGYCKQSEPFYRRLTNGGIDHQKVRLIAVFPQRLETSKEYLDCVGIAVDDIRQPVSSDLKVKGTPTLVLVNADGIATNEWVGFLSHLEEVDIMSRLSVKPQEQSPAN